MRTLRNYPTLSPVTNLALEYLSPTAFRLFSLLHHWDKIRLSRFAYFTLSCLSRITHTSRTQVRRALQGLRARHFLNTVYYDHNQKCTFYVIPAITTYYLEELQAPHPRLTEKQAAIDIGTNQTLSDLDHHGTGSCTMAVHNSPSERKIRRRGVAAAAASQSASGRSNGRRDPDAAETPDTDEPRPAPPDPEVVQDAEAEARLRAHVATLDAKAKASLFAKLQALEDGLHIPCPALTEYVASLTEEERILFARAVRQIHDAPLARKARRMAQGLE